MSQDQFGPIVVVCPNPSLDRTVTLDRIRIGALNRAVSVEVRAGGKGVNVARVLHRFGHRPVLLGPLGGHTGATVRSLAAADGLDGHWIDDDRPTRICTALADGDGAITEVNEPGLVSEAAWAGLIAALATLAPGAVTVISGSMPEVEGSTDPLVTLLDAAAASASVWVDTSGPPLVTALGHTFPPTVVKVNLDEATAALTSPRSPGTGHGSRATVRDGSPLAGHGAESPAAGGDGAERPGDTGVDACRELARRTGGRAVVTLGADGLIAADNDRILQGRLAPPAGFRAVNPTGCGDSLLAGLVSAQVTGLSWPEAIGRGLAAAVSNLGRATAGSIDRWEVAGFEKLARVAEIRPSPYP